MQEVADAVGVSRMTVSRALRNDPKISDGTKVRVRNACLKLGYQPDPRLSELMSHLRRSRNHRAIETIGYLHLMPEHDAGLSLLSERRVFDGCCARSQELGFRIDEFSWIPTQLAAEQLIGIVASRGIRGVVLRVTGSTPEGISTLYSQLAIATSDASFPHFNHAIPDHFQGMSLVVGKLWELGYRRIGFYLLDSVKEWAGGSVEGGLFLPSVKPGGFL